MRHATEEVGPVRLNALFHWKRQTSLVTHLAAKLTGKKIRVNTIINGEVTSTCAYWVPLEDGRGETTYLKARGVDYIAVLPGKKHDQEDLKCFPQLVAARDEQAESRGQIQLMIALDNWRYMPVRQVIGRAGSSNKYDLDDMKFLARTQFGKRLVLLDALDASEVIPPETGDGLDEKDGIKTSAREDEKMPSGSIRIQEGGKAGNLRLLLKKQHQKCLDSRGPQREDSVF